jgi:hypothetical protein
MDDEKQQRIRDLEERVLQLEELVSLGKAKCRVCGAVLLILPTTEHVWCTKCNLHFGDAQALLAEPLDCKPDNLEWVNKDGYEITLLLSHVRRDVRAKYPKVLKTIP